MKIICIIQARMGSERLPGKVVKPIKGIPLIGYTINRLKRSRYIDEIILATSDKKQDDKLVDVAKEYKIDYFRGSEENVLERYVKCSEKYNGDIIIRITGDCPLIDPIIVDNVITELIMYKYDYVRLDVPNTFVRGFDVEVFTKESLLRVYNIVNEKYNNVINKYKEHVTLFIYENKELFNIGYVKGVEELNRDYRVCVDTFEDFQVVENVIENMKEEDLRYVDIIHYIDRSKVNNFNKDIVQKNI
ncbi:glycosyltransferase family protein [Clostridium bornimense]|uniref:cytidylyltransferase domain-containing protein n=1 Tax=Clostridium bornimense TaxID=1216932 RepID=UPI001C1267A9|nr:glycosyltransferase family protein [Clostridium bornimense]MBU5314776.1 glycosyltransferase family protein [Clostridium bornimense]